MEEESTEKTLTLKSLEKQVNDRFKEMDKEMQTIIRKVETLQKVLSGRQR